MTHHSHAFVSSLILLPLAAASPPVITEDMVQEERVYSPFAGRDYADNV